MSDAAMVVAGSIACLGLAGAGSAFGTGLAAAAAVGAWKKCYAANKPAPFLLLSFVGAPITQTLYGMILMFIMLGKTGVAGAWIHPQSWQYTSVPVPLPQRLLPQSTPASGR